VFKAELPGVGCLAGAYGIGDMTGEGDTLLVRLLGDREIDVTRKVVGEDLDKVSPLLLAVPDEIPALSRSRRRFRTQRSEVRIL